MLSSFPGDGSGVSGGLDDLLGEGGQSLTEKARSTLCPIVGSMR